MRILIILLLCSVALAQDAVVVELPNADAIKAKTLYDAKVAADKAWDQFNGKLTDTYKGFYNGIEFSSDFRFIVPRTSAPNGSSSAYWWGNGWNYYCGCNTLCLTSAMTNTSATSTVPAIGTIAEPNINGGNIVFTH